MADVDPYNQPIPKAFLTDPEIRAWFEYDNRWKHDIWVRTGGGDDSVSNITIQEKYAWELTPQKEDKLSEVRFPDPVREVPLIIPQTPPQEVDRFNAVSTSIDYTACDFDFVNAKSKSEITLPLYPKDNSVVIIRNGDGTLIKLNGNGRLINSESTGKIYRKGTALTLQYFIDDDEWFAR